MALRGCCCCGLRGGAKSVGVLFLVYTLLELVGVIAGWAVLVNYPTNVQGIGVNTPEGQVGFQVRETQSVLRGRGEDVTLNLGRFGKFGGSVSADGRVSVRTPGGQFSSDGTADSPLSILQGLPSGVQALLICYTVYVLLAVTFNSMLIHGTDNDSSCAVLAWLVFYGAMFVCISLGSVASMIAMAVLLSSEDQSSNAIGCGIGGTVYLLVSALLWFWWAVVLTFYRELRDGTSGFKYQRDVSLQEPPAPRTTAERKAEAIA